MNDFFDSSARWLQTLPQNGVIQLIEGALVLVRRTFFNELPTVKAVQTTSATAAGPINGKIVAFDPTADTVNFVVTSAPRQGAVQVASDGTYTYTPDAKGFTGTDSFTVKALDSTGSWLQGVLGKPLDLLDLNRADGTSTTITVSGARSEKELGGIFGPVLETFHVFNGSQTTLYYQGANTGDGYSSPYTAPPTAGAGISDPAALQAATLAPGATMDFQFTYNFASNNYGSLVFDSGYGCGDPWGLAGCGGFGPDADDAYTTVLIQVDNVGNKYTACAGRLCPTSEWLGFEATSLFSAYGSLPGSDTINLQGNGCRPDPVLGGPC